MTSSFTTNKNLELPGNGDYVDTWNVPVNGDMNIIDQAFGGVTSLNATSGSATLTSTQYRSLILSISGAISANVTYTIPSGVGGSWIVRDTTTDASGGPWVVTIASGGGGTSVDLDRTVTGTIYSDGTNIRYADSRPATAAGSNTQIQYNNNGLLGASSTFVRNGSGNVGIGTGSPTEKLTVDGTFSATGAATLGSTLGVTGAVTGSSSIADNIGNVRNVPINSQTGAYALVATDNGKFISITTGGVTVNSGIFSAGQSVTIYNDSGSSQTITQGTSVTMYQVGTANTGNRTLAQRGLCTVFCVASNTFVITGGGLT
jgi:hypothetical protein